MDLLLIITVIMAILMVVSIIIAILQYKKAKSSKNVITQYFPDIKVIQNFPSSNEEAKEKIDKEGYSIIREDLVQEEAYILSPVGHYKKIIDELSPYLDKKDTDIIIICAAICKAQDENQHGLAIQLHKHLVDTYIARGKYTYNRFNSGVFQSTILPYLNELKQFLGNDKMKIARLFQTYYDSVIDFVADRIWVGEKDNPLYFKSQIQNRFNRYSNLKILWVHARKPLQVFVAREGCKSFVKENPNFEVSEFSKRELRGKISITLKIIRNN